MNERGHFRQYESIKFPKEHLKVIEGVNHIINEYEAQGFSLTLRQIYYQFVARDWMDNNDLKYKWLGGIVSRGRMAGLISWTAIEDRGRNLRGYTTFESPKEAVKDARDSYKIDMWQNQPFRVEVWVEKAALEGVIGQMCNKLRVDFFATRGYNSQSEQWEAGRRFARYIQKGQRPIVFHLGDHDPSGLDMTRDNRERLSIFAGMPIMVQRLALNMDQIERYGPPSAPGKITDGRLKAYEQTHGTDQVWELDALDPKVIHELIEDAVLKVRDQKLWDEMLTKEVSEIRMLDEVLTLLGSE